MAPVTTLFDETAIARRVDEMAGEIAARLPANMETAPLEPPEWADSRVRA